MPKRDQEDQPTAPDRVDPVGPGNLEIFREYLKVRERLDAAEAIINERFVFRAEAEAGMKASHVIEGALHSVLETQKARIRDLTKEIEKYSNLVVSHLQKMPDFMIVSITHADNLQVCGECPTPADLHRHAGFYYDHVHIKKVALYAKIEFPFDEDDTMAVTRPELMKFETVVDLSGVDLSGLAGKGKTMAEEKVEETEQKVEETEQDEEEKTEGGIQIEIEEVGPEPMIPYLSDEWEKHLDQYRNVMELCYDRALSVCVMPEIAGKMALAMYASIVSSPNAAYREFLDAMQVYMERIAPEPTPLEPMPAIPFPSLIGVYPPIPSPDFQKPSEIRQHEGIKYDEWMVITEYPNGDYHVSCYHEGQGFGDMTHSGKDQAMKCYREVRDHPAVRRAFLVQNISDQVPAQGPAVTEEAKPDQEPGQYLGGIQDKEKEIKPPAEKPDEGE